MNIVIRPYRQSDRDAVIALTVAAFDGVSIDHNLDRRLGPSPVETGDGGKGATSSQTSTRQEASWQSRSIRTPAQLSAM